VNPWLETLGVLAVAGAGAWLGHWFSRLPKPYWLLGYFIPLAIIAMIGMAYHWRGLELSPPFSWLMAGRRELVLTALLGTVILTTPLSRLPRPRDRAALRLFIVVLVLLVCAWPFLAPAFNRATLAAMRTRIDADGICRQNTDYTCGPAAAVTALRKLGLPAEEGELAQLAHTTTAMGTPPDILCETLRRRYGGQGLACEYRAFRSVAELRQPGYTLAVIKFGLLVDHYVTVLSVDDHTITVGDPFRGKETLSHDQFARKWRQVGVVLNRKRDP
jgi:hypothetical protein